MSAGHLNSPLLLRVHIHDGASDEIYHCPFSGWEVTLHLWYCLRRKTWIPKIPKRMNKKSKKITTLNRLGRDFNKELTRRRMPNLNKIVLGIDLIERRGLNTRRTLRALKFGIWGKKFNKLISKKCIPSDNHNEIEPVPRISEISSLMTNEAKSDTLENEFDGKDRSEHILWNVNNAVSERIIATVLSFEVKSQKQNRVD